MERRSFLIGTAGLLLSRGAAAQSRCEPTEPNIEGPFYRAGAPFRDRLGELPTLQVSGTVRTTGCEPVRNGVIEVWQANEEGEYDLQGFRHRGVVRCNANGGFRFPTVQPGRYLNGATYRPAHIHVKVHADGRPTLTTQLYFPGDPHNDTDPWFRPALVLRVPPQGCGGPRRAIVPYTFFFVV